MSSDGTRKQTRGWDISPTRTDGQHRQQRGRRDRRAAVGAGRRRAAARVRASAPAPKHTGDVQRRDVRAGSSARGRGRVRGAKAVALGAPGMFVGFVAAVGIGGGFALSRRHAALTPVAEASTPAAAPRRGAPAPAAPAAAAPRPTVLAAASPGAEAAPAPVAADDDAAEDDAAQPAPASHAALDRVKTKSGHGKRSRSPSGKTSHHHSSKHAIARKHSSSRHP